MLKKSQRNHCTKAVELFTPPAMLREIFWTEIEMGFSTTIPVPKITFNTIKHFQYQKLIPGLLSEFNHIRFSYKKPANPHIKLKIPKIF